MNTKTNKGTQKNMYIYSLIFLGIKFTIGATILSELVQIRPNESNLGPA